MSHSHQRPYPVHPNHLLHSKWSTAEGYDELEYCHWEVTVHYKKSKEVLLRATLNPEATIKIDWRELRDRARWSPGWRA